MTVKLPVFKVSPRRLEADRLAKAAEALFGAEESFEVDATGKAIRAQAGPIVIEEDRATGGFWAADRERLWNPAAAPKSLPVEEASSVATDLLKQGGLLPELDDRWFVLRELPQGATWYAEGTGRDRVNRQLDVQGRLAVAVRNPGVAGEPDLLPVIGGGGKFSVALGEEGRPIRASGLWRTTSKPEMVEALDAKEAEERFRARTRQLKVQDVRSFLAYYSAPVGVQQDVLAPVWVFGGTLVVDDRTVPMRLVIIPATEYGPIWPKLEPQPARKRTPGRLATTLAAPRRSLLLPNPFEAGTSWIGESGGLTGSQANARGFVDGLAAEGWNVNFNWGDANAWESDWRRNDDTWVDAADFVFYTGHADMNGWVLASPDDGSLHFSEVGGTPANPGDLWGQQDLEWTIVAACGPLQDEVISAGGGNVLNRWDGAFDGLHQLLGYGAITFDNTEEGGRVVELARDGESIINAWFRTATEIQPSTNDSDPPNGPDIWVGVMWLQTPGANPVGDHIWGRGSVSADPRIPASGSRTLACMWTTT